VYSSIINPPGVTKLHERFTSFVRVEGTVKLETIGVAVSLLIFAVALIEATARCLNDL
jgi:hypothetical protein